MGTNVSPLAPTSVRLYRLSTFWPILKSLDEVFTIELSQNGLFWNDELQKICCVHCGYKSNLSQNPLHDHMIKSPACKRLTEVPGPALNKSRNRTERKISNVENVESDDARRNSVELPVRDDNQPDLKSQESHENFLKGKLKRSIENGILFDETFVSVSKRRDTFDKLAYVSREAVEKFSKAGFVHHQGVLRCFCCGLVVLPCEIENITDPWQVHAERTLKTCEFVRIEKGDDYLRNVTKSLGDDIFNDAEVTAMISSTLCGQLINMGFSRKSITIAAHARKKTVGEAFPNMESIIDALDAATENADPNTNKSSDCEDNQITKEQLTRIDGNSSNKKFHELTSDGASGYSPVSSTNSIKSNDYQVILGDKPSLKMEIERISEENESLRDRRLCRVCMDAEIDIVFLKCGHYLCCSDCAAAVKLCPVCREVIRGTVRVMAPTKSLKRI